MKNLYIITITFLITIILFFNIIINNIKITNIEYQKEYNSSLITITLFNEDYIFAYDSEV